jgi:serine/threonine-protein kinase RsbW
VTATQQPGPKARPTHQLEMRVIADPAWLPSLRVVAADLATRADFDLDMVSDLRMAVDEACAELVAAAQPGAVLVCRFAVGEDGITVSATIPPAEAATVPRDDFGWQVLRTLTDEVEVVREGSDGAQPTLGLRLRKLRQREGRVTSQ